MESGSTEPVLSNEQLLAYVETVDIAELAAAGHSVEAMGRLASLLRNSAQPAVALSVLAGWLAGGLKILAISNGLTEQEMAVKLRADGAL